MLRYERLQISHERIERQGDVTASPSIPDEPPELQESEGHYDFLSNSYGCRAIIAWLVERPDVAAKHASRSLHFAELTLFGEWRSRALTGNRRNEPPSQEYWRRNGNWVSPFTFGTLFSANVQDWKQATKFAQYLQDDAPLDGLKESERACYFLLAGLIRDRPWDEMRSFYDLIQSKPQKREKLLARMLAALATGTDDELKSSASEYFKYFRKTESQSENVHRMTPVFASVIYHVARHRGRPLPLSQEVEDWIIKF